METVTGTCFATTHFLCTEYSEKTTTQWRNTRKKQKESFREAGKMQWGSCGFIWKRKIVDWTLSGYCKWTCFLCVDFPLRDNNIGSDKVSSTQNTRASFTAAVLCDYEWYPHRKSHVALFFYPFIFPKILFFCGCSHFMMAFVCSGPRTQTQHIQHNMQPFQSHKNRTLIYCHKCAAAFTDKGVEH